MSIWVTRRIETDRGPVYDVVDYETKEVILASQTEERALLFASAPLMMETLKRTRKYHEEENWASDGLPIIIVEWIDEALADVRNVL